MRRKSREVTNFKQQVEIIKQCDVCRIAFNGKEIPYIFPLNFGVEVKDGTVYLYFHGAKEGLKYDYLDKQDVVAFEMDCNHTLLFDDSKLYCTMVYESIIGKGKIELVPNEDKVRCLTLLNTHYHPNGFPVNMESVPYTNVFRMTILEMTGKSNIRKLQDPNMHTLL
ncbi:MAG: pyridoxamine 5'-phosphate oxidase family protein [Phocaeicola sp.]|uniref:pyridoxamine 5'-phosphate oxidase family protein n=1 Tax=Phocaeicola sp. TaxID=2773926 RepID=UPI003FA0C482